MSSSTRTCSRPGAARVEKNPRDCHRRPTARNSLSSKPNRSRRSDPPPPKCRVRRWMTLRADCLRRSVAPSRADGAPHPHRSVRRHRRPPDPREASAVHLSIVRGRGFWPFHLNPEDAGMSLSVILGRSALRHPRHPNEKRPWPFHPLRVGAAGDSLGRSAHVAGVFLGRSGAEIRGSRADKGPSRPEVLGSRRSPEDDGFG